MHTDFTKYVNPNIGTIGHLLQSTAPNVQSPHGAAVIAPVFRAGMKDRYISDKIFGFTAGAAIVMPCVGVETPDYTQTASGFDHDFESAHPDWYEVMLEDSGIIECHTAMENYGAFAFDYPAGQKPALAIYLKNCKKFSFENGFLYLEGQNNGAPFGTLFALPRAVSIDFFDVQLPNEYEPEKLERAKAVRIVWADEHIFLPFVLSAMGRSSALSCYEKRVKGKAFADIQKECNAAWNAVLGKIRVTGGSETQKTVFYTALYRTLSRMHNYSVNGKYLGFDGKIHNANGHNYYCDDGIWDTFRGAHPLQLLLEPKVHEDIVCSYLRMYQESGWLPRFPHLGGNIPCMIGHHTVSILAESMEKGVDFDWELAYEAAYKNATRRTMLPWRDGEAEELTKCYYEKGFFPALDEEEEETCPAVHSFENRQSVAVTMEHAFDDWCLAQMAEKLGKKENAAFFRQRSKNYQKVYDPEIGFVRPRRMDGSFVEPYNPKFCGGQGGRKYFAENNAYIYNFAAQHDIPGTMEMMGGAEKFAEKLDNLYIEQYDGILKSTFLMQYPDATGLMGQFCMGNEPSFHIPYLYNYCGEAYKTQRKVRELMKLWFTDSPLGICGDEDGGAMSAWFAFSAMGFYPVNPASGRYDLGSPLFDKIEIDLPNGKTFTIDANGASGRAKYIQSAKIGEEALEAPYFTHAQMLRGETLTLEMGERPKKTWNP